VFSHCSFIVLGELKRSVGGVANILMLKVIVFVFLLHRGSDVRSIESG